MKIIMLDCDGVLNWAGTEEKFAGFIGLDPVRIARFNKIIEAVPGAKIVVSSTWRLGIPGVYECGLVGVKGVLQNHGVIGDIMDITPTGRRFRSSRGQEIRRWLANRHTDLPLEPIDALLILDDDTDGMPGYSTSPYGEAPAYHMNLTPHQVVTHWTGDPNIEGEEGGLLDKHIEQAVEILNKPFCWEGSAE